MKILKLQITGMSCAQCAKNAQAALCAVPGVQSARVDFLSKLATITTDAQTDTLIAAVEGAGYKARLAPEAGIREREETRTAKLRLSATIAIGVLLFGGWMAGRIELVLIATALAAVPILWRAGKSLVRRRIDADVLVSVAVIAAASIGEFFPAGEVAFIMLLGAQLEDFTARRARRSIGNLLALVPAKARVRRDGAELEIAATEVRVGDTVVVRAGDRVPVDGVIRSGAAAVNQVAITGESMPVERGEGDEIYVGSLAETGALLVEATRVGEDTTLARIARIVEQAHHNEAPIQRTLDRLAGWLVPVMLALAVAVFAASGDIHRAITVLIVACPCALVLATPTAVMAGIARAARAGILIKGGQHLEAAARLHTIVFDKTGTLTHGQPEVTHAHSFCTEHSEAELVHMAAVAEKLSGHPLAAAIRRRAGAVPDPARFEAHHGRGVTAEHNGQKLVVGKRALLDEHAVALPSTLDAHVEQHHEAGHTTVLVAHDGKVCGSICIADTIRATAKQAIAKLRQLGIENVVMLTGDNRRVALHIASQLGVDEVRAEVLPEQKAEHINALRQRAPLGGGVAMVGDGVNDAPALAVADVGIAMGVTGTDVAHEAADIALMADDLEKIAYAVNLSRQTVRVIQQGLTFALLYNVAMITTAATGHLHMIGGAIAHQFSSVLVILNAMRLLRYRA